MRRIALRLLALSVVLSLGVQAATEIKGGSTTDKADVDANKNLQVVTPTDPTKTGTIKLYGQDGLPVTTSGAFSGAPTTGAMKNRTKVGLDTILLYDPIDGATIHDNLWQRSFTTAHTAYANTVATGALTINSGNSTAANSSLAVFSPKNLQRVTSFPLVMRWRMKVLNQNVTCNTGASCSGRSDNAFAEAGFMTYATLTTSSTAQITDGAFFRFTGTAFQAVVTFNSTDTTEDLTAPNTNWHSYMIVRKATGVDFYVDDVQVKTITAPATQPAPVSASRLNAAFRAFNATAGSASAAPRLEVGESIVFTEDAQGKPWGDQLVGTARSSAQSPSSTYLQTANHANSTSPTSATLSNTAAGYTTLGGRYQFAAAAGAATDFALFGYQVPAGFTLFVSNVTINTCLTGAAIATTATVMDWGIGVNANAVSLATADAAPTAGTAQTFSVRRMPLGVQGFPLVAPRGPAQIGDCAADIVRRFDPPLVIESARFFDVILQIPVGTATASQVFRGDVNVNGYFE